MKTLAEIKQYLGPLDLTAFSQEYRLPLRTLSRIRIGHGNPTKGTLALVNAAITRRERKKGKS